MGFTTAAVVDHRQWTLLAGRLGHRQRHLAVGDGDGGMFAYIVFVIVFGRDSQRRRSNA